MAGDRTAPPPPEFSAHRPPAPPLACHPPVLASPGPTSLLRWRILPLPRCAAKLLPLLFPSGERAAAGSRPYPCSAPPLTPRVEYASRRAPNRLFAGLLAPRHTASSSLLATPHRRHGNTSTIVNSSTSPVQLDPQTLLVLIPFQFRPINSLAEPSSPAHTTVPFSQLRRASTAVDRLLPYFPDHPEPLDSFAMVPRS